MLRAISSRGTAPPAARSCRSKVHPWIKWHDLPSQPARSTGVLDGIAALSIRDANALAKIREFFIATGS